MQAQRLHAPIPQLHPEMGRFFNGMLAPFGGWAARDGLHMLPLNVWEDADSIHVEAEVPGVKKEDLEIFVHGAQLKLRGKWLPAMEKVEVWHRQERHNGEFSRVVELPARVDANNVEASLKDGVLHITLSKAPEYRPRRIAIEQIG